MKFKWPWSPASEYSATGRGPATPTDNIGMLFKKLLEATDRVDNNVVYLKHVIEEMYRAQVNTVRTNRKLREEVDKLQNERKSRS